SSPPEPAQRIAYGRLPAPFSETVGGGRGMIRRCARRRVVFPKGKTAAGASLQQPLRTQWGGSRMKVTVRAGDTFWRYSQLFRVPLNLILDSNPGVDPARLAPGASVDIPGYEIAQHRVAPGESLRLIASARGIPPEALLLVNPGIDPYNLQVGQIVRVPVRVTWL